MIKSITNVEQLVGWELVGETEIQPQCHFDNRRSYMIWPGIEPGLLRWGADRLMITLTSFTLQRHYSNDRVWQKECRMRYGEVLNKDDCIDLTRYDCGYVHILWAYSCWYKSQVMGSKLVAWPLASITSCHYTSHPLELTDVLLFALKATRSVSGNANSN
jgi:hypothetical protein